jgi:threonine aldolase
VSVHAIPGEGGRLDLEHLDGRIRPDNLHFTPTRLLCLENSTNLGGGRTYSLEQIDRVCRWAHAAGLKTHLDGARLFNACAVQGYSAAEVSRHFDTVSVCFSKGLGCPVGSILVGSVDDIARARRARKLFGGALRQAGIPAAACLYALDHHVERLSIDHAHAKTLATLLAEIPGIHIALETVETNLVFFEVAPAWGTAAELSRRLRERGVLINPAGGPQRLRACTHLDVSESQIFEAARLLKECLAPGTI